MLEAVKGYYENGKIRLLEKPHVKKSAVLIAFLDESGDANDEESKRQIDWEAIRSFRGHADKWRGVLKNAGISMDNWKDIRAKRIMEKHQ